MLVRREEMTVKLLLSPQTAWRRRSPAQRRSYVIASNYCYEKAQNVAIGNARYRMRLDFSKRAWVLGELSRCGERLSIGPCVLVR
jgi:hypothetical protein